MSRHWTLTIDLRENRESLLLEMCAYNADRSVCFTERTEIHQKIFQNMTETIDQFFAPQTGPHARLSCIERFNKLARSDFKLDEFLQKAGIKAGDDISLSTMVTEIPWDLVPFQNGLLGHQTNLGLRIPLPGSISPNRSGHQRGRPRFLHIVSDPDGDLSKISEEVFSLREIVNEVPELDYCMIKNPSSYELIECILNPQPTPFVHYSGHLSSGSGLRLKEGEAFLPEEIIKRFPYGGVQVVFLNGCDDVYGGNTDSVSSADSKTEKKSFFQMASVANAFLAAGSKAVIAPRSKIEDRTAAEASSAMWKNLLAGKSLGQLVRDYRQKAIQSDPNQLNGYSFVLYGNPAMKWDQAPPIAKIPLESEVNSRVDHLRHPVLLAAQAEARDEVSVRHIFIALTRQWSIGWAYLQQLGHRYILALEDLRQELNADERVADKKVESVRLSSAGKMVLNEALKAAGDSELEEIHLLHGIAKASDPEVGCALEASQSWPRDIDSLLRVAKTWAENGSPVPGIVLQPDGSFLQNVFLSDIHQGNLLPGEPAAQLSSWDLLMALALANSQTRKYFISKEIPLPEKTSWKVGMKLHWSQLTESCQNVLLGTLSEVENEDSDILQEALLTRSLAHVEVLGWDLIPQEGRARLQQSSFDSVSWDEALKLLRLKTLGWSAVFGLNERNEQ